MNINFAAIDLAQLSTVSGGAGTPSSLVLNKLNSRFGSQGVVSYIGHPKFTSAGNGIEHGTGKFDVNALWGGDTKRSFSADVNTNSHSVSGLHTHILGSK